MASRVEKGRNSAGDSRAGFPVYRGAVYRGDWSFAELLDWHLLRGTRPDGSPDPNTLGKEWDDDEFAAWIGFHANPYSRARNVQNWRNAYNLPDDISAIDKGLFGENLEAFKSWRADLQKAYRLAEQAKKARRKSETSRRSALSSKAAD